MTVWSYLVFCDCNTQAEEGSNLLVQEFRSGAGPAPQHLLCPKIWAVRGTQHFSKQKPPFLTISILLDKLKVYIAKLSELFWAIFVQREEHMLDSKPYTVTLLFHGTSSLLH